ncbi:hypothetical protein [Pseudoruegeria sp. SK021]|uniref:hypothetical protein n=1 Tax=Pseudoruegeria sp. SK021 TaxID=1933035 RepID=UPI000A240BC5|nr:hypothetical protein [Pseudoruegeria sp. SK021]OSP56442.1 hypothetical protein BV911_00285 [Pseudoruegeria sp. SK021]
MELIVGTTRIVASDLQVTEGGVIARLSGAALASVLDATFGGTAAVDVWANGQGVRPMTVTGIHMTGNSSTVTLTAAGAQARLH